MKRIAVLGGGGHAQVVVAAAVAAEIEVVAIYDDASDLQGQTISGIKVVGPISAAAESAVPCVVGIGDNAIRKHIVAQLEGDVEWATVVHPFSWIHGSVGLGEGTVVFAGAVIQPQAHLDVHCIVNTGATIDHDCKFGGFCHVAPGAHLAGNVTLGPGVFMGIGACAVPGIGVGEWSIIGAGAVVVKDVPANVTSVGAPAKTIKEREAGWHLM